MTRRYFGAALGLGVVLAIACASVADAKFRGTDLWNNLMPAGGGSLINRYPLSSYQLDVHVDSPVGFGGISTSNLFASIGQFLASTMWFFGVLFMRLIIVVFQWAFNVDLINGTLGQASTISQGYYVGFVQPFLAVGIVAFGAWLGYKTVKTHERSEAGQALVRVVVLFVVSIAIVFHPQQTIGAAFNTINGLSSSLVARGGNSHDVADSIFSTFVYKPWAVLEFGGLRVCTGAQRDSDNFPLAATSANPAKVCHSVLKQDADGHGDYARRFLRYSPDSGERQAEYDALRTGVAPDTTQFAGATIDRTDSPAVDLMQAGGTLQRLAYVALMLFCMVAGALLLGLIAVAALFAQIAILALLLLASFTVLAAVFPPLHDRYMGWLKLLGKVLVGKAVFSLMIAIVLAASGLLLALGGQDGYFVVFGLQALLFGGVFVKRKAILEKATSSKVAQRYAHHENHTVAAAAGAATMSAEAISGGAATFAATMRKGWGGPTSSTPPPDSSSPPASAGREHSPPGKPHDLPVTSDEDQMQRWNAAEARHPSAPADTITQEDEMPTRSFQDDLERARTRESSGRPASQGSMDAADTADRPSPMPSPVHHGGSVAASSFSDELEAAHLAQERPLPPDQLERLRRR